MLDRLERGEITADDAIAELEGRQMMPPLLVRAACHNRPAGSRLPAVAAAVPGLAAAVALRDPGAAAGVRGLASDPEAQALPAVVAAYCARALLPMAGTHVEVETAGALVLASARLLKEPTMNENRRQILDMLAEGKITADEAERLLAALEAEPRPAVQPPAAPASNTCASWSTPRITSVPDAHQGERAGADAAAARRREADQRHPARRARPGERGAAQEGHRLDINQLTPENLEELIEELEGRLHRHRRPPRPHRDDQGVLGVAGGGHGGSPIGIGERRLSRYRANRVPEWWNW